jgi:hypothetical protein
VLGSAPWHAAVTALVGAKQGLSKTGRERHAERAKRNT